MGFRLSQSPIFEVTSVYIHIQRSARITADVYKYVLLGINPQFKPGAEAHNQAFMTGFLSEITVMSLLVEGENLSKSEKFLEKHVFSRILFATAAPVSVVTRVADGLLSLFTVPLSLMTGGTERLPFLHTIADSTAQAPGVLCDIFRSVVFAISPHPTS